MNWKGFQRKRTLPAFKVEEVVQVWAFILFWLISQGFISLIPKKTTPKYKIFV
jgi:hypothetical protein